MAILELKLEEEYLLINKGPLWFIKNLGPCKQFLISFQMRQVKFHFSCRTFLFAKFYFSVCNLSVNIFMDMFYLCLPLSGNSSICSNGKNICFRLFNIAIHVPLKDLSCIMAVCMSLHGTFASILMFFRSK